MGKHLPSRTFRTPPGLAKAETRGIKGEELFFPPASSSGVAVSERIATTFSAFYACVNVLASDIPSFPFRVVRTDPKTGSKAVQHGHPYAELFTDPNDDMTGMNFLGSAMWWANTHGNAYSRVIRDSNVPGSRPRELRLLDSDQVQARKASSGVLYYDLGGDSWTADDIIHIAAPGSNGIEGKSPVRQCRESIALGIAVQTYGSSYFGNGTNASGFIEFDGDPTDDELKLMRKHINEVHQGTLNAHKLLFITGGGKYRPSSVPPEDAQFLATRLFQLGEMCRILRVPPSKVMNYEKANFSTLEETNYDYYTSSELPWLTRIDQAFTKRFFTRAERRAGLAIEHDPEHAMKGKLSDLGNFYKLLRDSGVLTSNEIRARLGLPPRTGGDALLCPLNSAPLDLVASATIAELKGIKAEPTPAPEPRTLPAPAPAPEPRALPATDPAPTPAPLDTAKAVRDALAGSLAGLADRIARDEARTVRDALATPGGVLPVVASLDTIRRGQIDRNTAELAPTLRAWHAAGGELVDVRQVAVGIDRQSTAEIRAATEGDGTLAALRALADAWETTRGQTIAATLTGTRP